MGAITRNPASDLEGYINRVKKGDYSLPSDAALRTMSGMFDRSIKSCYDSISPTVLDSKMVQKAIADIKKGPRLCGSFSNDTAIMADLTSFEQMSVVSEFINSTDVRKTHTLSIATSADECVPLWIKPNPRSKKPTTTMSVLLGNVSGKLKAPEYAQWALNDPMGTDQERFVDILNSLELVRQPFCSAALTLKATSYEHQLPHSWRYQVTDPITEDMSKLASVELSGQSKPKVIKVKEQSAGFNLASMVADRNYRNQNVLREYNYEDYADKEEGYNDDVHPHVTPKKIVQTFEQALKGDTSKLDKISNLLFATRLGISNIPAVSLYVLNTLFDVNK